MIQTYNSLWQRGNVIGIDYPGNDKGSFTFNVVVEGTIDARVVFEQLKSWVETGAALPCEPPIKALHHPKCDRRGQNCMLCAENPEARLT